MNERMLEEGVKAVVYVIKALMSSCRGKVVSFSRARIIELYLGAVIRKRRVKEYLNSRVSTTLTEDDHKKLAVYVQMVLDKLTEELDLRVGTKSGRGRIYILERGSVTWFLFESLDEDTLIHVMKRAVARRQPIMKTLRRILTMRNIFTYITNIRTSYYTRDIDSMIHWIAKLCAELFDGYERDQRQKCTHILTRHIHQTQTAD